VLSDSQPVRSCLSLALDCDDKRIETIEGLSSDPAMQALQQAFIRAGAFQCGFCTPGMLVAAFALLTSNQRPSEIDIRRGLSGNLCRCTGYKKIVEAVLSAAEALACKVVA
jgi:carbon-monoxide dehydrogenase small subunit